ncbi:uncharacterized protein LOC34618445 [Cyclospora cayetanensis]|uniref:Small ribosomal subunit protein mS29 n=1 Tax=Cyclospora cayetanensis TaxID=88456 RepID=A0A6P6RSK9_9EIME|nr:uncharacterized protein LOC34618445 [Cyclospora cayetanensis]
MARAPAGVEAFPESSQNSSCSSCSSTSRRFASFDLPRHPTRTTAVAAERQRHLEVDLAAPTAAAEAAAEVAANDPHSSAALFAASLASTAAAATEAATAEAATAEATTAEANRVHMPCLFIDPSGERVPLVQHCSVDQRDAVFAAAVSTADSGGGASSLQAELKSACGFAGVGVEDIGRFRLFSRRRLLELMPEGFAGELNRDMLLIPSSSSPVGIMLRKSTLELQLQLQHFADVQAASYDKLPTDYNSGNSRWHTLQQHTSAARHTVNTGFLLDGHRGVGKSFVLNYLVTWARENGWLVLFEPLPSKYARDIGDIKRSSSGVYIQSEFARVFLERFLLFNHPMLADIPVDMKTYGQAALDGVHRKYAARAYEALLESVVAQDLEEMKADFIATSGAQPELEREKLKLWRAYSQDVSIPSIRSRLKQPTSVLEVALFGAEQEAFATQACYEVVEQLKKQTRFNILTVIDEWNECFPVSEYLSMRYEETKFGGRIPAYHLALPRLLSPYNGAQFKRGLKIVATSWKRMKRRDYRPEFLGVKAEDVRTVRNFSPLEFASYVAYLQKKRVLHNFPLDRLNYFYMLCGGNGFEARRLLSTLY